MAKAAIFDWSAFEEKATSLVRAGIQSRRGMERLFQFIALPAFDTATGWEVFRNSLKSGAFNAARTEWLRRDDFAQYEKHKIYFPPKLQELSPTIKQTTFDIEGERIENLMGALKKLQLSPVVEKHRMGCDGISFGLSFGNSLFLCSSFHWWVSPPDEWNAMIDAIMPVIEWLEQEAATRSSGASEA